MKKSMSLCIFWLQMICALATAISLPANTTIKKEVEKYGQLKIILEDLQNQIWEDDEALCLELLTKIIRNVQNSTLWATWIWDSMQNPVGLLYGSRNNYGNYDECLEFEWEKVNPNMKTQYCLTHIHLAEVEFQMNDIDLFGNVKNYMRSKTKHHLKFNTLNWGVCTPVSCKAQSVAKFVNVLFRQTHLGLAVDKPNITIDHCDVAGENKVTYNFGYYFTVLFVAFVVIFTFSTTAIVNYSVTKQKCTDFFKAFHVPTNIQSLMKITDNNVRSLSALRVMSSFIVVGVHVLWFMVTGNTSNALRVDKDHNDISLVIFSLEMTVDTFLLMSGLLLTKSLMIDGYEKLHPLKVIVKRYFRIVWLLSIVILLWLNLFEDVSLGPTMKVVYNREIHTCQKNWWASLLMIHNYVDTENMCHPVTWSTAVDFHLSVLATMICWAFSKNRKIGIFLYMISFIASIAVPALFVYSDYRRFCPLAVDFRLTDDYRKTIFLNKMYISTHFRAGSYLVGMALGYTMYKYDPVTHRSVITKKYSILGFILFIAMILGIFVIGNVILKRDYSPIEAAVYLSLKRIVWAVCIGIFILICEYGTLPLVTSFLSWSALAPISRLTYGIYLVHMLFAYYLPGATRRQNEYNLLDLVLKTFGISMFSVMISLFLWTFFEAPMQNIVSFYLKPGKKQERRVVKQKRIEHEPLVCGNLRNRKKE